MYMKNIIAALKRAPKRSGLLAVVASAVILPASLFAWGPGRPAVDPVNGADHVVFNSITENPNYGNERQFITVQDPATGKYSDNVTVQPGKEYTVRVLAHNNANANLDLKAINTTLKTVIENAPAQGQKKNAITAYISADNAVPQKVYADAFFNSDKNFNLAYVPGSAMVYNNGYAAGGQGKPFSDSLVTSAGAKLGFEQEGDGIIPGCYEFINYVYFKVKPQFAATPDFTVEKSVSKEGANSWKENLAIQPGETVDYRIKYKNTGDVQQDNVVVKDQLPEHMNYVPGSAKLYNTQNPNGKQLSDNITGQGINIGSHAAGASSFVAFKATADSVDKLECGVNSLTNTASVETDHGKKDDTAVVTIPKECQPGKINVCELATKKIVTINESDFDSSKHSKNVADCNVTTENCPIPGKENLPKDSSECVESPAMLPETGTGTTIGTFVGIGALVVSLGYYVASRRGLSL
jgi:uncharacterized repeat protein (TIGR01451 family)/LPXTG-motif cell wall-anchored protein